MNGRGGAVNVRYAPLAALQQLRRVSQKQTFVRLNARVGAPTYGFRAPSRNATILGQLSARAAAVLRAVPPKVAQAFIRL